MSYDFLTNMGQGQDELPAPGFTPTTPSAADSFRLALREGVTGQVVKSGVVLANDLMHAMDDSNDYLTPEQVQSNFGFTPTGPMRRQTAQMEGAWKKQEDDLKVRLALSDPNETHRLSSASYLAGNFLDPLMLAAWAIPVAGEGAIAAKVASVVGRNTWWARGLIGAGTGAVRGFQAESALLLAESGARDIRQEEPLLFDEAVKRIGTSMLFGSVAEGALGSIGRAPKAASTVWAEQALNSEMEIIAKQTATELNETAFRTEALLRKLDPNVQESLLQGFYTGALKSGIPEEVITQFDRAISEVRAQAGSELPSRGRAALLAIKSEYEKLKATFDTGELSEGRIMASVTRVKNWATAIAKDADIPYDVRKQHVQIANNFVKLVNRFHGEAKVDLITKAALDNPARVQTASALKGLDKHAHHLAGNLTADVNETASAVESALQRGHTVKSSGRYAFLAELEKTGVLEGSSMLSSKQWEALGDKGMADAVYQAGAKHRQKLLEELRGRITNGEFTPPPVKLPEVKPLVEVPEGTNGVKETQTFTKQATAEAEKVRQAEIDLVDEASRDKVQKAFDASIKPLDEAISNIEKQKGLVEQMTTCFLGL